MGNSVFLDETLARYPDQWAFLSTVRRIGQLAIDEIVESAHAAGRIVGVRAVPQDDDEAAPWLTPPSRRRSEAPRNGELPETLEFVLANEIYIATEGLPAALRDRLVRLAAFQNPEFYRAQAMRLPVYGKPRIIACAEDHPSHLSLPRGCLEDIRSFARS